MLLSIYLKFALVKAPDPENKLNNGNMMFLTPRGSAVTKDGVVGQPSIHCSGQSWGKLTYSNYPLDIVIAQKGNPAEAGVYDNSGETFGLGSDFKWSSSPGTKNPPEVTVDTSKSDDGKGIITAKIDFGGIVMTNVYNISVSKPVIEVTTTIKNEKTKDLENIRVWVGTRDDYLCGSDSVAKSRVKFVKHDHRHEYDVLPADATELSNAIKVESSGSAPVTVFLFGTDEETIAAISQRYGGFQVLVGANPNSGTINTDGAYAIYKGFGNFKPNEEKEWTWFYGASKTSEMAALLGGVISSLYVEQEKKTEQDIIDKIKAFAKDITVEQNATTCDGEPDGWAIMKEGLMWAWASPVSGKISKAKLDKSEGYRFATDEECRNKPEKKDFKIDSDGKVGICAAKIFDPIFGDNANNICQFPELDRPLVCKPNDGYDPLLVVCNPNETDEDDKPPSALDNGVDVDIIIEMPANTTKGDVKAALTKLAGKCDATIVPGSIKEKVDDDEKLRGAKLQFENLATGMTHFSDFGKHAQAVASPAGGDPETFPIKFVRIGKICTQDADSGDSSGSYVLANALVSI